MRGANRGAEIYISIWSLETRRKIGNTKPLNAKILEFK